VQVGDRKFALVEHSLEFSLVSWRPVLERQIGREISRVVRGGWISWTIGRRTERPQHRHVSRRECCERALGAAKALLTPMWPASIVALP
jgi:hypothetical protein